MTKNLVAYSITFGGLTLLVIFIFDSFVMPSYVRMHSGRYLVNVVDKKIDYAEKVLETEGYKSLVSDTLFTTAYGSGTVVDQYPTPNTRVKKGRTVRLKIAQPEKMVPIPDLIGRSCVVQNSL